MSAGKAFIAPGATLGEGPRATPFIAPGATLGVVGGGQLGRMFVHAAQRLGYRTVVLDADPASRWLNLLIAPVHKGARDDPDEER